MAKMYDGGKGKAKATVTRIEKNSLTGATKKSAPKEMKQTRITQKQFKSNSRLK